jgi:Escherichia/Staphylococcus phage prohead protease
MHLTSKMAADRDLRERLRKKLQLAADDDPDHEHRDAPGELERRFPGLELRAAQSGGKRFLEGTAIRYDSLSSDLGGFIEKISPGAFAKSITANPSLAFLHSHDPSRVLGTIRAGTLTINDSVIGLAFRVELPASAADIWESVARGDTRGCSFGFRCVSDLWADGQHPDTGERISIRTVVEGKLFELSTTAFPAYASTDVAAMTRALFPSGVPMELRSRRIERPERISDEEYRERARLRLKLAMREC